jgi:antitoxin component YwqK of YwqJK toxin-antitoxin module
MQTKLSILTFLFIVSQFAGIMSLKGNPSSNCEIIIKDGQGTICTRVSSEKRRMSLKTDRYYYGYQFNELFFKQGTLQGKPLDGTFNRYDLNGNNIESGYFDYGLKNGLWKKLSANGNLTETTEYRKGRLCGKRVVYKNGIPEVLEHYRKGHLIGKPKLLNPLSKQAKGKTRRLKKKNQLQTPLEEKSSKGKVESDLKRQKLKKIIQRFKGHKG